jgi:SOS-response transcriptional repressor LexA
MKIKHRFLDEHTCEIWLYLHDYIAEHGMAPSYREIADHTFISVSTVQSRLDWLEMRAYIQRKEGIARSIVLLKSVAETPELCEGSSTPH